MANQEITSPGLTLESTTVLRSLLNTANLKDTCLQFDIQTTLIEHPQNEPSFSLKFVLKVFESKKKSTIVPKEKDLILLTEMLGTFSLSSNEDAERTRNYKTQSAPMILFPYLRAFVSNLTNLAGITPITLPTVFIKLSSEDSTKNT